MRVNLGPGKPAAWAAVCVFAPLSINGLWNAEHNVATFQWIVVRSHIPALRSHAHDPNDV